MKKLAAILLLSLFLCKTIGYRVVYFFAQQQSDKQFIAAIDNEQYNDADLITIKVPLSMPYQIDQPTFERVNGEVSFKGKIYKYVKRKIEEGNLVLLCIPDYDKMRLQQEKNDFNKDANNLAQDNGSKQEESPKSKSFKNILTEYDQLQHTVVAALAPTTLSHSSANTPAALRAAPHGSPEQPPELA